MNIQIKIIIGQTAGDAQVKANEFLAGIHADNIKDIRFENNPYSFFIYILYKESI